jgi:hypothetical protein
MSDERLPKTLAFGSTDQIYRVRDSREGRTAGEAARPSVAEGTETGAASHPAMGLGEATGVATSTSCLMRAAGKAPRNSLVDGAAHCGLPSS